MKSDHANAANLIKKELKLAFPKIKFEVKSKSFSGGTDINVNYENGPTRQKIYDIVNKYVYGEFNSMDDSYNHKKERSTLPQVKYLFVNRSISADKLAIAKEEIGKKYGVDMNDEAKFFDLFQNYPNAFVRNSFNDKDID